MSSSHEVLIVAEDLSKVYQIFDRPADRLRQILWGRSGRKFYREFHALTGVSFEVERGTSLGVIGRNGAGKSTLLQLITGTLEPTRGSVSVRGRVAAVLELGAGFNPEFSGRENIELYCNLLRMSQDQIKSRFDRIVEFSELQAFIDQPLKTYSSGMVARLAFSVIAHVDADILIVDEALSVGDAAFSQKCMRFFRTFRKNGTIFFVSHDLAAVKAFCDKAIWLEGGNVRAYGDSRSVCEAYLAEIYPASPPASEEEDGADPGPSPPVIPEVDASAIIEQLFPGEESRGPLVVDGAQRIEAFSFDPDSPSFGSGGARITNVVLRDTRARELAECPAQQLVLVTIEVEVERDLARPIVGFFVKDRLGQPLFGGNTYLTYSRVPFMAVAGKKLLAHFVFRMPTLLVGDYSITAAIAEGTLEVHTQLHWAHDAAFFKVTASSLDGVLVGIPMEKILMAVSD